MPSLAFRPPTVSVTDAPHHANAAAGNIETTTRAIEQMDAALSRTSDVQRILLKAAAGAGKSSALQRMVQGALEHRRCARVGITAFANKQLFPLAEGLGSALGRDRVCLLVAVDRNADVSAGARAAATVVSKVDSVPGGAEVIIATSHMLQRTGSKLRDRLGGAGGREHLFDVLFVDEAWQLALHRYRTVERFAPISVGVGDVGQLPPLDPGQNPWRGDRSYNPYRAWPTAYRAGADTWAAELPAVWRPIRAQLPLWQAFYSDWEALTCVAGPGDRRLELGRLAGMAHDVWQQVATGLPTLVELDGLDAPDAPDVDLPLLDVVEGWLDELLASGFTLHDTTYDATGWPSGHTAIDSKDPQGRTLIAVLATRNQAVDDAQAMVERLVERHGLADGVLVASTVDSWQGQTNALTVAIHPLSGASALDEFNSAFGRLAVTCTRATHGLLLVSRAGLDDLLATAPPRPGTPLGEPGTRQLPRQTHQRILGTFARTQLSV